MTGKSPSNHGTISEPIERDYPKLAVEAGKAYSLNRLGGNLKEIKEYWVGYGRGRVNPVTIGRETSETMEKRDIVIDKKYQAVSREHAEIFLMKRRILFFS